ncbi:MAG: ATP-binding protein [Paraprevotella sp.]|nr:ATP-binding protein [Paraprevotella sp.]
MLKRQKEQHLDELKFRFFTNISHEFRTPLALIITPLELLIRKTEAHNLKNELEKILDNAKDLLRLVNQLLDFRRLEQKGEHLKLSAVPIKSFIEENVEHFDELSKEHHITLACECQFANEDLFYLDAEKMTRVFNNLLSNAIKFTPNGGIITVQAGWIETASTNGRPTGIRISVSDTGIGIPPQDLEHIFTRFYQSDNTQSTQLNTGSGIGLHLTKGYIDLHKGTIKVESTPGKGSSFILTLPSHDEQEPLVRQSENTPEKHNNIENEFTQKTDKTTIWVTEDNVQFLHFMKNWLQQDFHVLTAADGQEGLNMAREYDPDLIISDVMMPNMDGYAFCRAIKTDMKCSHIPFILLTAKKSSESRSEAYDAGADSFIAKPFDVDVLSSRIRQLLEQREKRRDSIRRKIDIDPKEITITPIDEELMQKVLSYIEKNMSNTEYNVKALSADMGIERSLFYRKMQAIAGQTPSDFMRSIRLKRAAQLLKGNRYSVQEISWMVGFNTPRYFSSYFKEMFGMTPSQYAQQTKGENE